MPKSNIAIMWTLCFTWYVVGWGSKNGHHKNVCLKEIRLCAKNMINILSSIINIIVFFVFFFGGGAGLYQHLMRTRMLTLKMNNALMNSENHQANGCMHDLDLLIISH